MMAAIEQFLIDESWTVAPAWRNHHGVIGQLKTCRLASPSKVVRLHPSGRVDLDRSADQQGQGGGVAVEETGQPGERQFQGRKVRREARQRCQRLNRPHRFLRCRLGHSQGQEELVHPMPWLQEFCQSLENSDLPLARYFRSTLSLAEVSLTSLGKSNELFPCPPPYPWVHEIVTDPGSG